MGATVRSSGLGVVLALLLGSGMAVAQRPVVTFRLDTGIVKLAASGQFIVVQTQHALVTDDVDSVEDVYVHAVASGTWRRLSRPALVGRPEHAGTARLEVLSLSDDGRFLAYITTVQTPFGPPAPPVLARYDLATGTRHVIRDAAFDPFRVPVMSRDGSAFAWVGAINAVLVGTVGQSPTAVGATCPPRPDECHHAVALTRDGRLVAWLAAASSSGPASSLETFDRVTMARASHPQLRPTWTFALALTASGRHALVRGVDGTGGVYDLAQRRLDPVDDLRVVAISDDARYVLRDDGVVRDGQSGFLLGSGANRGAYGLSGDGRLVLARIDDTLLLLDLDGDGDGMYDPWETVYRLDPASHADGVLDADGDGISNRDEYARGSHPRGLFRRHFAEGVTSAFFDTRIYDVGVGIDLGGLPQTHHGDLLWRWRAGRIENAAAGR